MVISIMSPKTKRRITTATITLSLFLLAIAAFLYAGPYLAPGTFKDSPPEQYKKYVTVTDCFFYTGLFGLIDGIWRRRRIDKAGPDQPSEQEA